MEKKVDRTGPRQVCESRRKTPGKNPGPWLRPSSQCHQAGVSTVEFHQVTFHQKSQNMAQLCPNNQEEGFNLVEMILPNKILALPPGISNLEQIQKLCQNITSHTSHLYKSLQVDVYGRFITLLKPGSNQHAPHSGSGSSAARDNGPSVTVRKKRGIKP